MKKIDLFCDGSCLGNPGVGGWGAILRFENTGKVHEKRLGGGAQLTTNNQMELIAVIESLKALKEPCSVTLYSDSSYVCRGINEWLVGWVAKNFKNVKNPDLWKAYLEASKQHKIKAVWVRGHVGHIENEECDKMAREFAEQMKKA
jgi:ribonuclease HI